MTYKIQVYEIIWQENDDTYVGSTKSKLSLRMAQHRSKAKCGSKERLYDAMRKYKDLELKYVLLEHYVVSSWDEQLKRERQWQDEKKPSLNMKRPILKPAEAIEEAEKIKKRNGFSMPCFCGGKYNFKIKAATKNHTATKKHQKYLKLHHEAIKKGLINNKQVKE